MNLFSDSSVWAAFISIAVLLIALFVANILRKTIKPLRKALIPTSVLAGLILLSIAVIYNIIATNLDFEHKLLFDAPFFGGKGYAFLEMIAYHMLALGFIASTLQSTKQKMNKQRSKEIFDSGVTTVATYLLQGVLGIGITIAAAWWIVPKLVSWWGIDTFFSFPAAGVLLPFGYGQGTGQALNYGSIYEAGGFLGGKNFGLTIAAFGFLSASIGGVIHLMILKKKNPKLMSEIEKRKEAKNILITDDDSKDGSLGKLTVQITLCTIVYVVTYSIMYLLAKAIPGLSAVIYGFNFLFGVLAAIATKAIINQLRKWKWVKKEVTNDYLLSNVSNFCFDMMIVAGIAAIRLDIIDKYWSILLILGLVGLVVTYAYNMLVAKVLFPAYKEEQFLAMYGMLTGTASTGVVLLREIDPEFRTGAATNLVYQTLPAMVFGFPMMLLATFAPENPLATFFIMLGLLVVMNIILFRSFIFRRRRRKTVTTDVADDAAEEATVSDAPTEEVSASVQE